MKATGRTTSNMASARKSGEEVRCTWASTIWATRKVKASLPYRTDQPMTASGIRTNSKGTALNCGQTEDSTAASGRKTTCMATDSTCMQTRQSTSASSNQIRKAASASTHGQMGGSTRVGGAKGSSTVSALTKPVQETPSTASGITESE